MPNRTEFQHSSDCQRRNEVQEWWSTELFNMSPSVFWSVPRETQKAVTPASIAMQIRKKENLVLFAKIHHKVNIQTISIFYIQYILPVSFEDIQW